jgi:hypothetical protein
MFFCNIDAIEQIFVSIVIKVGPKRFVVEGFSACPEGLIRANRRPVRLSLDHALPFLLRRWCEVDVSIQVVLLELDGLALHGLDFLEVVLVV